MHVPPPTTDGPGIDVLARSVVQQRRRRRYARPEATDREQQGRARQAEASARSACGIETDEREAVGKG